MCVPLSPYHWQAPVLAWDTPKQTKSRKPTHHTQNSKKLANFLPGNGREGGKAGIKNWQKWEKRARRRRQKCGRIFAQIGQRKKAGKTRKRHEIGGCPNCTSEGVLKNGYVGVPCALSKTALPEGTPGQFHAVVCGCKSVTLPLFRL